MWCIPDIRPESGTRIRWYKNGQYIHAFDDLKYITATGVRGDIFYYTVTPGDGYQYGSTVQSAPGVITNTPPTTPTFCEIVPHNPQITDNLYLVVYGSTDADGDPITYKVKWYKNDVEMVIYRDKFMVPYTEVDEDDVFTVSVTAYDGFEESE